MSKRGLEMDPQPVNNTNTNRNYSMSLTILALVLLTGAAATSRWGCGNLYKDCPHVDSLHIQMIGVVTLYTIGLALVFVSFFMDLVMIQKMPLENRMFLEKVRMVLIFIGGALLILAVNVFTTAYNHLTSYLCAVTGAVLAMQVVVITLMTSECSAAPPPPA